LDVAASFNTDLEEATLEGRFELLGPDGTEVEARVAYDEQRRVALLTPAAPLKPNGTYQAVLRAGVSDLYGNALASERTWSFTVEHHDLPVELPGVFGALPALPEAGAPPPAGGSPT